MALSLAADAIMTGGGGIPVFHEKCM